MKPSRTVRNRFAEKSDYYDTKGHAVSAFSDALDGSDFRMDCNDLLDFYGDEGSKRVAVYDGRGILTCYACFYWYRMPSGRYEFTGYLS